MSKRFGLILIQHTGLMVIIWLAATLSETKATLALPNSQTSAPTAAEALVKPDSPAFKDLEALVNRYNCIVGYPGKKDLKSMTRFEFAGVVIACFDRMNELLAPGVVQLTESDTTAMQRLWGEFAVELATIRGSFSLSPDTATLEKQQFSTTTKLQGTSFKVEPTTAAAEALVKPDSPPFKALEALVNRYDCIVGYPNRKYLKAMTRFEFAAALNACLDQMNELLTAGVQLPESEKITIHWLQEEFAPELERFQQGMFTCTPSTCTLEKQQFSTTTKLQGTPLKVEKRSP